MSVSTITIGDMDRRTIKNEKLRRHEMTPLRRIHMTPWFLRCHARIGVVEHLLCIGGTALREGGGNGWVIVT